MERRPWPTAAMIWTCALGGCALLGGCMSLDAKGHAQRLAQAAGLHEVLVRADPFVLTSFFRVSRIDQPIDIYIEGDGRAWLSRTQPSADPTPRRALALQLAVRDPAPNVVYLARPCQFTKDDRLCNRDYWTGKRYSAEVIGAMDEAVSHYASLAPGQPINLIGYSGGGAVSILVAARRTDIASIRTVAGNLDVDEVVRLHGVTPMPASINPLSEARQVAGIPQIHFSGGLDTTVPPSIAARFAMVAGGSCVQTRIIPGLKHEGNWPRLWPQMLAETVHC